MFARNFTVRLKSSLKSNFVVIPESYRKLISTCKTGCLLLNFLSNGQYKTIYVSWANTIQVTTPFEAEEIELNNLVGELWGLRDGMSVSCSVIQNSQPLKAITISLAGEDFEMAECSSERIQYDLLDQLSIVARYQPIMIWLNKSISVKATVDNLSPSFNYGRIQNDTEVSINRKLTQDFLRPKPSVALSEEAESDAKMKRRSAIERSETMDLSNLRRNNSFIDSHRRFLDKPEVTSIRRPSSNGWSDHILDVTDKKPPLLSPRGSFKRSQDSVDTSRRYLNGHLSSLDDQNYHLNPLSVSSSLNSLKRMQEDSRENGMNQVSNSLSATNIRRVQEKSKQFLETLESAPKQQRHLINSISSGSIPSAILTAEKSKNVESPTKTVEKIVSEKRQNHRQFLEDLRKTLERESQKRVFVKIHIDEKKSSELMQINEVYVSKSSGINVNQIHLLKTKSGKEYHVRAKLSESIVDEKCMRIHPVLAKILDIENTGEKVEILAAKIACNLVDGIKIVPTNAIDGSLGHQIAKDIEEKFKKYVNSNSRVLPLVINQGQLFKLDDYLVTMKLFPASLSVCCVDSEISRENIIEVQREGAVNEFSGMILSEKKKKKKEESCSRIKISQHEEIVQNACNTIHAEAKSLSVINSQQSNVLLAGPPRSGKKTICSEIKKQLTERKIHFSIFHCSEHKGRKVESIVRDMRSYLMNCVATSPSVLVINNLDSLANQTQDEQQTQESEYLKKLSNNIRHLLEEFTHDYGSHVSILVTVEKMADINKILFHSFGYYLFKNVFNISNLASLDRLELLKKLFSSTDLIIDKSVDWERYSRVTEGYHIGDISQFVDRAIFFSVKNNCKQPTMNEEFLNKSLTISNQLCLSGIKTDPTSNDEDNNADEEIPGMTEVIATLEEILIWPTKFPNIFNSSPLKNQAGILLFGCPGIGKTFIVSQITKKWNLRLISIKGPELLAKYIGQSEENVRNLFEKAKSAKPCVLFFDEFDSLAPRRGHDSTGVTDRVVNQLLTELDGVKSLEGVSVICATSRPDLIDPALLRSGRIDRLVECNLPNAAERFDIIKWLSKSLRLEDKIDLKDLSVKLESFSGADIKSVLTTANMQAIEDHLKNTDNVEDLTEMIISSSHIENAVRSTKPAMTRQDIEKYKTLYEKFKCKKSITTETPKKVSLA